MLKGILDGVTVLDLTRILAGPFCTMILSDLGAEVIKLERPKTGDDSRHFGPFIGDKSAYYISLNRGKKSIVLDLKAEKEKMLKIVSQVDVLVENFRPGTMERLGLSYNDLKKINPKLIYASISGFGHSGPDSTAAAYDIIVQARGGIMSITGEPEGPPVRVGASIGDINAALFGAIGIIGALYYREKTGLGQFVDVAMLDSLVATLENAIARYFVDEMSPKPLGTRHPSITPFEAFKAKDDWVIIAVGNDSLWEKFCQVIGREDLAEDARFATNGLRTENHAQLKPILDNIVEEMTKAEIIDKLSEAGIPTGPVNTIDKLVRDPQIAARKMLVDILDPEVGLLKAAGNPIKLSLMADEGTREPAPELGEHTEEILKRFL